ncbi:FAD-dependent oxidoreductase [Thalassotalea atypica]|uniref:FAD-dependent oxidoreductase n=1 Tax=Thalassotalea atypica TaxID=2054316 RepID=UPI0025739BE8|nr:NAD(P)/FAD-dependent oxidoreductase [Thalassotalea atypica]
MNTPHFTLVGGGLVGSLLSIILARKGYQVDVYESRADMRKVDISAGRSINLALANRGIKPLQDLGLMDEINQLLIPMRGRMIHLDGQPSTLQAYGQSEQDVIYSISRAQLNSFLMTKAEQTGRVNFHFEHRVTAIDFDQNILTMTHQNQQATIVDFNKVIGTDGANSPVRTAILNKGSTENEEAVLDHSYKELTILPDNNGEHKLEKHALHIWPRGEFMLIALPNLDGSFTVTLFMPNHGVTSFDSIKTDEEINNFFAHHFIDIQPLLDDLTDRYQQNPTGRLATIKCAPWHYNDQALIVGDAAHAIVPFHGQGMNCGFEDCDTIAQLVPELTTEPTDWQQYFKAITAARKVNADAIANMALENYVEMRDSVRQHEFLLKKQFSFKIQEWFPERFTPRYAMVMFEHIPYSQAFELGKKHQALLSELTDCYSCSSQLDKSMIDQLLRKYDL